MKTRSLLQKIISPLLVFSLLTLALTLMPARAANAQDDATKTSKTEPTLRIPMKISGTGLRSDIPEKLALFDTIKIPIDGLAQWAVVEGNDAKKFILHINGIPIMDTPARLVDNNTKLQFHLKPTSNNAKDWAALFSQKRPKFYTREGLSQCTKTTPRFKAAPRRRSPSSKKIG